jgi:proteasome component ECM29
MDQIPAGMGRNDVEFVTNKMTVTWTLSNPAVKDIKISILKFCMVDKVISKDSNLADKYILGITAMADTAHEVRSLGDNCLKRFARPNFEQESFVLRLYTLYKGSDAIGFNSKSPATTLLKQKIIDALCKSALATNQFPLMIQVAFDALYSDITNTKLRLSGMMFVQWIARMAQQDKIEPVAPVLLSGLLKLIDEPNTDKNESQRAFGYEAIGLLSKRVPKLFESDFGLLAKFFDALKTENRNVCVSVQEALVSMALAYKASVKNEQFCQSLKDIILDNIDKNENHARYVAINYATRLFPFSDPFARYICLLAASDAKLEIREQAFTGLEFPSEEVISEEDSAIPSLVEMVKTLDKLSNRTRFHVIKTPGVTWIGNVTAETFTYTLIFLHQLLIKSIIPTFPVTKVTTYLEDKPAWLTGANKKKFQNGLVDIFMDIEHVDGIEGFVKFIRTGLDAAEGGMVLNLLRWPVNLNCLILSSRTGSYRSTIFDCKFKREQRLALVICWVFETGDQNLNV